MFVLEDEIHAEPQGEFLDLESAMAELRRRSQIPWDQQPNRAPCTGWRGCGREYEIIEYDQSVSPSREVRRIRALEISSTGINWRDVDPTLRLK